MDTITVQHELHRLHTRLSQVNAMVEDILIGQVDLTSSTIIDVAGHLTTMAGAFTWVGGELADGERASRILAGEAC